MVNSPEIEILTYNNYEHNNTQGRPCHGIHDSLGDPRSMHKPRLSRDIVSFVESCFYFDVPIDSVSKIHINKHLDMDVADLDRYFFLSRKHVANIYAHFGKGKYQLHQKI